MAEAPQGDGIAHPPRVAIKKPVAVVHSVFPQIIAEIQDALDIFEKTHFAPGSPTESLFQIIMSPWYAEVVAVIVFPEDKLAAFIAIASQMKMQLEPGIDIKADPAGRRFDAAGEVKAALQLHVPAAKIFSVARRGTI